MQSILAIRQQKEQAQYERLNESNTNFLNTLKHCDMIKHAESIIDKANEFIVWLKPYIHTDTSMSIYLEQWFILQQQRIPVTEVEKQMILFWTMLYIKQTIKAGREPNAIPFQ